MWHIDITLYQILYKHTIIYMFCSKCPSNSISHHKLQLQCDIAMRNPFLQNKSNASIYIVLVKWWNLIDLCNRFLFIVGALLTLLTYRRKHSIILLFTSLSIDIGVQSKINTLNFAWPTWRSVVKSQGRSYSKMKCTQICLKVWWSDPPHLAEVALRQGVWGRLRPPEALG
jgi:hypothetical protein